jgi:hypothetical protein
VQYNLLVASTSLRRINGHFPAHGRVCGQSMRCVSFAPLLPGPQPLALHLSFLCCSCPFIASVPRRIGCSTHRNPIWARKCSYLDARLGNCIVHGSESGCCGRVGVCGDSLCMPDPSISFFFRDSSVSMAFIGPNFFCVRSIFTSFSARHSGWASPREFFSIHLLPLRAMRNCPPLCLTSHAPRGPFPFHFWS